MTATTSKSQRAYDHLHERIERGVYGPGYRLVLDAIARDLDMSVVPVREALRRLEAEGVVTFERNVGARVTEIDPDDLHETTETLAMVEGAAIGLAVPSLTEADVAEARRLNEQMRESLAAFDPVRLTRLNEAFHRTLTDPCPNEQLKGLVDDGWRRLARLRQSTFGFVPGRAHDSVEEHERILRLLEAGAPAHDVELAVRDHRLASLHAYLDRAGDDAHATESH
ncbi:GntR family transcriptional regulator [Agrococcus versicolor]|uniref:GntR family transcriptional regulator n=1 Tax=Agrococcus versicolor TaxID=501482 RepID=A0ABN3ALC7_9MICO